MVSGTLSRRPSGGFGGGRRTKGVLVQGNSFSERRSISGVSLVSFLREAFVLINEHH